MKKFLFIFLVVLSTVCFAKEKISEQSNTLLYKYEDWNEFYEDLVKAINNPTYRYSYLQNVISDGSVYDYYKNTDKSKWQLYSSKEIITGNMNYKFIVISPNQHVTTIWLSNRDYSYSEYRGIYLGYSSGNKTFQLETIQLAYDTQITFFDEEVPMTFTEYLEKNNQEE